MDMKGMNDMKGHVMICLMIAQDGTMTVGTGESIEDMQQVPVKSIDEALSTIKQMADSAAMPQDGGMMEEQEGAAETQAAGEEDDAMNQAYRPGIRG